MDKLKEFWKDNKENIEKLFTYEYYKDGLTGWNKSARVLWFVGMAVQAFIGIVLFVDRRTN